MNSISISVVLSLFVVSLSTLQMQSLRDPSVPYTFYPFGSDEGDNVLDGGNVVSPAVNISGEFPYLSDTYRTAFVSTAKALGYSPAANTGVRSGGVIRVTLLNNILQRISHLRLH